MKFKLCAVAAVVLIVSGVLQADVSLRFSQEMRMVPIVPGQEAAVQQLQTMMQPTEVRIKAGKAYSKTGELVAIFDIPRQEMTMVDRAGKRFSTVPTKAYLQTFEAAIPQMPEQARKMVEAMKLDVATRKTGRSGVIHGIQAEESELTVTLEIPSPPGAPEMPSGMQMKMIMSMWMAKQEEYLRVPALRELAGFAAVSSLLMNPREITQQLAKFLPGSSNKLREALEAMMQSPTVVLRTRVEMYVPFMATMMQELARQGRPLPEGYEPDGPLMRQTMELVELSTDPVDETIFQIPADYTAVPMSELMKGVMPRVVKGTP